EGEAPPHEEAGHQAPAGAPEGVAADQLDRLMLPEARRPGQDHVDGGRGGPDLDELRPGADVVEPEHAGRGPPHQDEEVGDPRP
ncbi:hypothetical protein HK102_012832, partial [Quaeritorhiza haematococci]